MACIVLPRLTRVRNTGVPLREGDSGARFEIAIGIFKPPSSSPYEPFEHGHVRYYTGTGDVLYIDQIYLSLWGDPFSLTTLQMEKYRENEIDQALRERHSLFPFSEGLAREVGADLWCGMGSSSLMTGYHDMRGAMHDDRAFSNTIVTNSGLTIDAHDFWGDRTARVLEAVG